MTRVITVIFLVLTAIKGPAQDTIVVNIDFGGQATDPLWNTLTNSSTGQLSELRSWLGFLTDLGIEVHDVFNGTNESGTLIVQPPLTYPATVTGDSFFGNLVEFSNRVEETGGVTLSGLDVSKEYKIALFASRLAADNRETQYTVQGGDRDTVLFLNVADNDSEQVVIDAIKPLNDGTIIITATAGSENNNTNGFFYLGAMTVTYEDLIVPTESTLSLSFPNGENYWQTAKTPEIRWESTGFSEVLLEYSTDGGATWSLITTTNAFAQKYPWTVPDTHSENCFIRVSADTLADQSDNAFTINNSDTTDCHIVVLGSSTAAGTGPTAVDSAWVWMYRDQLYQKDTRFTVTNLARGGFTTYNILPDGATIPANVSQTIDSERNVTQALSLEPNAVIINLPSNDAANGYTVEDQLGNYELILEGLEDKEIPYWICTPQPRNNFSQAQKEIQTDLRDSTFAIFGEFGVDFWKDLADPDSNANALYDSGDGVHLNNAGHKILLDRILDKNINGFLLSNKISSSTEAIPQTFDRLHIFPSPTPDKIEMNNVLPPFHVEVYDIHGQQLLIDENFSEVKLQLPVRGIQFIKVVKGGKVFGAWGYRE